MVQIGCVPRRRPPLLAQAPFRSGHPAASAAGKTKSQKQIQTQPRLRLAHLPRLALDLSAMQSAGAHAVSASAAGSSDQVVGKSEIRSTKLQTNSKSK